MSTENLELGKLIDEFITKSGKAAKQIAYHLDVSAGAVSKWRRGRRTPSADHLQHLCDFLSLAPEQCEELFQVAKSEPPRNISEPPQKGLESLQSRVAFFSEQARATSAIEKLIEASVPPRNALLVQYSSESVAGIVKQLLLKAIPVELFLQHPETAEDLYQKDKICRLLRGYYEEREELAEALKDSNKFKIVFYRDVATVRAVQLDDHLFIGFYTYETKEEDGQVVQKNKVHGHDHFLLYFPPGPKDSDSDKALEDFENIVQKLLDRTETVEDVVTWCRCNKYW